MKTVMPRAASGSAHQKPKSAFAPMPTSRQSESQKQASVWNASAVIARLPSAMPTRRFSRASHHMTTNETAARTIPTGDGSGRSPARIEVIESQAM
jgi:hypothetical protein